MLINLQRPLGGLYGSFDPPDTGSAADDPATLTPPQTVSRGMCLIALYSCGPPLRRDPSLSRTWPWRRRCLACNRTSPGTAGERRDAIRGVLEPLPQIGEVSADCGYLLSGKVRLFVAESGAPYVRHKSTLRGGA